MLGGITQQRLELSTRVQREGVKRLLRVAGIKVEGTIVDLGCRNGDTTLGIAEMATPNSVIIGVEEIMDALLIAKAKYNLASPDDLRRINSFLSEIPEELIDDFRRAALALPEDRFPSFLCSSVENLPHALEGKKANAIVGFQLLHWLNADETGLPTLGALRAINESLVLDGVFVAGTSTAFVKIDPNDKVEGKTRAEYVVDEHPFFKMVYGRIAKTIGDFVVSKPSNSQIDLAELAKLFTRAGFTDFKTGAFLTTFGREAAITEQIKLRPIHQGRLDGVDDAARRETIMTAAISAAHARCDELVAAGNKDPRLENEHLYDAVPFVVARKP